jgi:hypothetical protein
LSCLLSSFSKTTVKEYLQAFGIEITNIPGNCETFFQVFLGTFGENLFDSLELTVGRRLKEGVI